jgi:hypothetical protein
MNPLRKKNVPFKGGVSLRILNGAWINDIRHRKVEIRFDPASHKTKNITIYLKDDHV